MQIKKQRLLKKFTKKKSPANQRQSSTTAITNFSPTTIVAGNLDATATGAISSVLTITGTGFGTEIGKVFFRNANTGGNLGSNTDWFRVHAAKHIISWTDTEIKVLVPSTSFNSGSQPDGVHKGAGSGVFKVERLGESVEYLSPQSLTIKYSLTDYAIEAIPLDPASWLFFELHLRDTNGNDTDQSDFTFIYDASFYDNTLAVAAFRRALNTWRKATGVRFTEICNESFDLCRDVNYGTRVKVSFNKTSTDCPTPITFESSFATTWVAMDLGSNANQDPTGNATLKSCGGNIKAYINYMHIAFKPDNLDCRDGGVHSDCIWNFSSANNSTDKEYNFETVALHELGHLLMQQHVIEPSLMYWEGRPGVAAASNRTNLKIPNPANPAVLIDDPALEGVNYILGAMRPCFVRLPYLYKYYPSKTEQIYPPVVSFARRLP